MIQPLLFDLECPACHGAVTINQDDVTHGYGQCPTCGFSIETADLKALLTAAENLVTS